MPRTGPLAHMQRVCLVPNCTAWATRGGRCPEHQLRRMSPRPWARIVQQVLKRDGGICALCGQPGADSVDHVVRIVEQGDDALANLRAAHRACNQRRR